MSTKTATTKDETKAADKDDPVVRIMEIAKTAKFAKPFAISLLKPTPPAPPKPMADPSKDPKDRKTEAPRPPFEIVEVVVYEPSDFLAIGAKIANGEYKVLNSNTVDMQFLMYLGIMSGALR